MPLDLNRFVRLRPCLYHLTARSNVALIERTLALRPASTILAAAGRSDTVRERRRESQTVVVDDISIHIRDQAPLHEGNVDLANEWSFADFVAHLNDHVFFWPGTTRGPIPYGIRHFQRYADGDNAVLVLSTAEVFAANAIPGPRFCRYNSGSPRCNGGNRSPRGPDTFAPPNDYAGTPSSVVEVTFDGIVGLRGCRIACRPPTDFT